jgi:membrane-associated phospholipid phosphatase
MILGLADYLGFMGPKVAELVTIVALCNRPAYLLTYFVFFKVQKKINHYLKDHIKEPRPTGYNMEKYADGGNYGPGDQYGMPSEHSTATTYSTAYLWLVATPPQFVAVQALVTMNTWRQRYVFHKHYIHQMAVGAIVGVATAYAAVVVGTTAQCLMASHLFKSCCSNPLSLIPTLSS